MFLEFSGTVLTSRTSRFHRFRVSLSLALSSFIKKSEDLLALGPSDPAFSFANKFIQTQMFSNLVDRVDSECVFFHDLLDLLELTAGEDRGAINAGVSVLEEYGSGVETYKVPRPPHKEPAVRGRSEAEDMARFEAGEERSSE